MATATFSIHADAADTPLPAPDIFFAPCLLMPCLCGGAYARRKSAARCDFAVARRHVYDAAFIDDCCRAIRCFVTCFYFCHARRAPSDHEINAPPRRAYALRRVMLRVIYACAVFHLCARARSCLMPPFDADMLRSGFTHALMMSPHIAVIAFSDVCRFIRCLLPSATIISSILMTYF